MQAYIKGHESTETWILVKEAFVEQIVTETINFFSTSFVPYFKII